MSTTTSNYGFIKPSLVDPADITATNENWDKIDIELSDRLTEQDQYHTISSNSNYLELINTIAQGNFTNSRGLRIFNSTKTDLKNAIQLFDNDTSLRYSLYGDHNKPYGSYTGNGSNTSRTISIGGVGMVIFVTTTSYNLFVTNRGAFGFMNVNSTTPSIQTFFSDTIVFTNGNLIINGTDPYFNASGSHYEYRVL